jgi:branched-chain amino acid transport system permease protein
MEAARILSGTRSHWVAPFLNQPVILPAGQGADVSLTLIQLINAGLMIGLALAAHLALKGRFGRAWKAVRDDPHAAALCGVNPQRVLLKAHMLGVAIAGVAGILSTAWLGNMDFNASLIYGLKLVFLAALGGALSPGAAALGGAALAAGEAAWAAFAPLAWRDVFIFALLVFVLALRRADQPPG